MATFRYSAGVVLALWCLACSWQSAQEAGPSAEVVPITRNSIEHLVPKRDFVGPQPARFEWTRARDVDEYSITVENEVDALLFQARTKMTSIDWPKGNRLDSGTYFWRVVGVKDGRGVADSGRAAFVVRD